MKKKLLGLPCPAKSPLNRGGSTRVISQILEAYMCVHILIYVCVYIQGKKYLKNHIFLTSYLKIVSGNYAPRR